jgi:hypothetical protein
MISILDYLTIESLDTNIDGDHIIQNTLNDERYIGKLKNGLMHGIGKYFWKDQTIYEGEFKENQITGHGTMQWANGNRYVGEFLEGARSGIGTFFNAKSGSEYKGGWINNSPDGYVK